MKREKHYTETELKRLEELKQKKDVLKSQMAEIQKENQYCSFFRVLYGCKLSILKYA